MPRPLEVIPVPVLAIALGATACDWHGGCDSRAVNARCRDLLGEWYLYPDQLARPAATDYESPPDFVRAIVANVDLQPESAARHPDRFSTMMPLEQFQAMWDGVHDVFGFRMAIASTPDGEGLFLSDVLGQYPGEASSPASEAGLKRGWQVLAINGVNASDLLRGGDRAASLARARELLDAEDLKLNLLDSEDELVADLELSRASIDTQAVPLARILDRDGTKVGYFHLRHFFGRTAFEELRSTFADFAAEGVRSVVVDLRYNGGGSSQLLEFLGNLVAGRDAEGEIFYADVHGAAKRSLDKDHLFAPDPTCPESALCTEAGVSLSGVEQVVVIATEATASASEAFISGLQPHVPVSVIGSRTAGKPVGFHSLSFCDWVLLPVTHRVATALGPATYFDGIPPTCEVEDDLTRDFGDPAEGMLAAALHWIDTETCPEGPTGRRRRSLDLGLPGWNLPVGLLDFSSSSF